MEGEKEDDDSSAEPVPAEQVSSDERNLASPADVAAAGQNSFAKVLYNQNPFYLISCLLVIYGCQSLAISGGGLIEKSFSMAGGIATYTLLMAFVCIAVVRLAKVWDDARSIFIVVVISLVAVTTGFDELCIGDQPMALAFGSATAVLVILVTECVLWVCRIRFSFWYRVAFYSHFVVLIGFPLLLGRAVAMRNDPLANWGSVLFSIAIGATTLLLIPALRRGPNSIAENGTPWRWPLYPLSAFLVMLVLAGIRSHAIWISFGFYGTAGKFEPFLLLPILAAVLVCIAETGIGLGKRSLQHVALICTPGLLLCGITRHGVTWLPIQSDMQYLFGSALTVSLGVIFVVYLWMTVRGVRHAIFGLPATLMAMGFLAPLPQAGETIGLESWMFPAAACVILLWMTLRVRKNDWLWTALAGVATTTIAMLGQSQGRQSDGLIAATVFATFSMLIIGALFKSELAFCLRCLAAVAMTIGVIVVLVRSLDDPNDLTLYAAGAVAILSLFYGVVIRRRGWLGVATVQGLIFCAMISYHGHRSGKLRRINWPIASGLACLCVGVAITTGKTGMYRRLAERKFDKHPSRFKPGL